MERSAMQLLAKRGLSQRQIAAQFGRNRRTVARVLREPVDRVPMPRQRRSKVDPYRPQIEAGIRSTCSVALTLVFVPLLMWLVVAVGWRGSMLLLAGCAALLVVPAALLMCNSPGDLRLAPYGGQAGPAPAPRPAGTAGLMRRAVRAPEFWLLCGSFSICGATSAGLVGTHFIANSIDLGVSQVTASQVLGLMGAMNFVGTTVSGWLTDRYDPRKLLFCYYTFRGLSLLLPFVGGFAGLATFAVVFGLDYIATVPPTVALSADVFGRRNVGTIYGWVFASHQLGAASTAYLAGLSHELFGDYQIAFLSGGLLAFSGALMAVRISRLAVASEPQLA